jgi:bifunctional non-homologous end joining protein LigD
MASSSLSAYHRKRDFHRTGEPRGILLKKGRRRFVVHEHHATRLHFDLRLELEGVLKSWAVPKGPSLNPHDRRLAIRTEDHPVKYLGFQGSIADGNYGAGDMAIWDTGHYSVPPGIDPVEALERGKFPFILQGGRLQGEFLLVKSGGEDKHWLLFKRTDAYADPHWQMRPLLEYGSRHDKRQLPKESRPPSPLPLKAEAKLRKQPETGARTRKAGPKPAGKTPWAISLSWPLRSKPSPLPDFVEPMTAKLADGPFADRAWIFEPKWDGWRVLARIEDGELRLISRNRKSVNAHFPELLALAENIRADSCLLDGEVVALDDAGLPRFQLLQSRLKGKTRMDGQGRIVYYIFDLLHCQGRSLMDCPLLERKTLLEKIIRPSPYLSLSSGLPGDGMTIFSQVTAMGLEGLVAKRKDSPYRSGKRSSEWLKVKARRRQEVVIAGYTRPRGSRSHFGALVAGIYADGQLRFAGHVGGGFTRSILREVLALLEPLKTDACPFPSPPATNEKVQWLRPGKVAEVEFAEWTEDGSMRQPIFMGLRPDKQAKECIMEKAAPASALRKEAEIQVKDAGPEETHREKIYWPGEGITKGDLLDYYRAVSPYILPHLKDRPLILKRFPHGIKGEHFFQHDVKNPPDFLKTVPVQEEDGSLVHYALCQNQQSLLYLANLGTIPQNPWLSRVSHLDKPDWAVLDLDPQEVDFPAVCESARFLKTLIDDLGMHAFLKTSGSRGLHIYLPLRPVYPFASVLDFALLLAHYAISLQPDFFTLERSLKARDKSKIYLDCMQNSEGKSVASVYSVRERPGACVSAPLEWSELKRKIRMDDFTMKSMPGRLEKKGDLFAGVFKERNSLPGILKKLEKKIRSVG